MQIIITNAGLAAIVNGEATGTAAVQITKIGLGSGRYTPSKTQTALQSEFKQIDVIEGGDTGDNSIHVAIRDDSEDSYAVYEFGLYLADGKGRSLEKPKRKKRRHVQKVLRSETRVAGKLLAGDKVLNGELRRDLAFLARQLQANNLGG